MFVFVFYKGSLKSSCSYICCKSVQLNEIKCDILNSVFVFGSVVACFGDFFMADDITSTLLCFNFAFVNCHFHSHQ